MALAHSLPAPAYLNINVLAEHSSDDDNYPHPFAETFTCCWRLPLKEDALGTASSTLCGRTFESADLLFTHLSDIHVGRKTRGNLCLTCHWENCVGVTVTKRDHLTSHLRTHVRFKPHVCDSCGRAFKRPQDLKKHERIHSDRSKKPIGPNEPTQIQFTVYSSNGQQLNVANPSALPAPAATTLPAYAGSTMSQYARSETTPPLSDGSSSRHYSPVAHSIHSPRDGVSSGTPSEPVRYPSPPDVSLDRSSGVASVEGLLPAGSAVDLDMATRGFFTQFADGGVPQYNHVMQTKLDTFGEVLGYSHIGSGTPTAFTIPPYDITQMESWLNQLHQNIQDDLYHDQSLQHGSSPPPFGESGSAPVNMLQHPSINHTSAHGVIPPYSLTPDLSSSLTDRGITASPASTTSLPPGDRHGLSYPNDPNDPSSFFALLPPPPTTLPGTPATIAPSLLTSNAIFFDQGTSATVQASEHLKEQQRKLRQQEAELAQQQALLRQQQEQLRQQQLQLQQQLNSTNTTTVSTTTAGVGITEEGPRVVPRYNYPEPVVYTMVRQQAAYDDEESGESEAEESVADGPPPPPPRRRLTSTSVASIATGTSSTLGEKLSRTATGSSIGSLRPSVGVTPPVPPRRNPPKAGAQAPPPPARKTPASILSTTDSSLPPAVPPRKKPPTSKTNSVIGPVTTVEDGAKETEEISRMMETKLSISDMKGDEEMQESTEVEKEQKRRRLENHLRIVRFLMEQVRAMRAEKKQGGSGDGNERDGAVGRMVAAC